MANHLDALRASACRVKASCDRICSAGWPFCEFQHPGVSNCPLVPRRALDHREGRHGQSPWVIRARLPLLVNIVTGPVLLCYNELSKKPCLLARLPRTVQKAWIPLCPYTVLLRCIQTHHTGWALRSQEKIHATAAVVQGMSVTGNLHPRDRTLPRRPLVQNPSLHYQQSSPG